MKIPSLLYPRTRGDMIKLYKHTHGMYHIDAKYIKLDQWAFIQTSQRMCKQKVQQKFLTIRATNAWNQPPADVVNDLSLNAFKAKLEKA